MTDDRKIFIAIDVKGYSSAATSAHGAIQQDLRDSIARAAADARLPYDRWIGQPQGDGVLFMAPLEFEPRYIDDFVPFLAVHLGRRNRDRVPGGRLRVRVGLDQGPAQEAANGFSGEPPILACRLRDAQVTKDALDAGESDVVLVLSDQMFRDNVAQERTRITITEFSRIAIDEPKIQTDAWLWIPQGQAGTAPPAPRASKQTDSGPRIAIRNQNVSGDSITTGDGATINIDRS